MVPRNSGRGPKVAHPSLNAGYEKSRATTQQGLDRLATDIDAAEETIRHIRKSRLHEAKEHRTKKPTAVDYLTESNIQAYHVLQQHIICTCNKQGERGNHLARLLLQPAVQDHWDTRDAQFDMLFSSRPYGSGFSQWQDVGLIVPW